MKSSINCHCFLHATFKDKDGKGKKIDKGFIEKAISCYVSTYMRDLE